MEVASGSSENSSGSIELQECVHYPLLFLEFKMVLVGGVGALIAVVSTFNNLVLLHTFLFSKKLLPRRNLTYLTCLSFCDFLVSVFYISIMSAQVYAEYFDSEWLFVVWHECLPLAFTISNVTFAVGSFLLVAATIERYLQTINNPRSTALWQMMGKHRQFGVLLAVSCGLLLRGSIFFEIETYHLQHCTGLASMGVLLSSLAKDPYYDSIWRFWIRRITTIFVPFFVLAYCNSTIVYSVQMEEEKDQRIKTLILFLAKGSPRQFVGRGFQNQVQKSSARLRSATRMLIAVVTCYLLANMLDVFLASWEYLDGQSLAEMSGFYTVATDVSSLLSVLSSSLRLPIYLLVGDKLLQTEIKRTLRAICLLFTPIGYKGLAKRSIFNAKFKGSHHPNSPTNFGLQNSKQAKLNQQNHHLLESPLPLSSSCENSGFLNNSGIGVLIQARGVIFTSSKKATEMYVERKISSVEHIRLLDECGAVNETQVMQWTKEI